ncbi:trafficking protein particle complex subunit 8 isoform X2 [Achroia grisella]|uniref:trafficking protein particle complex subunit 8 isoform X2 n=1 Tax=Achroia grisella TaxID=688607 RepID=UPI0027D2D3CD|nr:trafficking protein particle complex subunit 8 isoform X2 [Achroia grisella]
MNKTGKTAQEFIQSSFSPIIAILCSPKVDNIVSKNNLSLVELLQPFANLDWEGQFREPGGSICTIKNWKIIIRDVNWKPVQPMEARRQLNNAVLYNYNEKTKSLDLEGHAFEVPQSTPWFDAWRETYLEVQFPSDHEFTKHYLACIIVGTSQEENIIDCFNSLNQQYAQLQNITPPKLPKWFNSGVLKSYLLLHDVSSTSKEKADTTFETLKQTFGASNSFMLSINSKSTTDPHLSTDYWAHCIKRSHDLNADTTTPLPNMATTPLEPQAIITSSNITITDDSNNSTTQEVSHPLTTAENDIYDNANSLQTHSFSGSSESVSVAGKVADYTSEVHGAALNANDIEGIKKFMQEYASKALLPYLEKQISQLSEVVANRKGVSRSLFSATKRWFGTGKGGNTTVNNTVIYSNDCPELQLRRLGDLWFMCGQWQRAFDTYHTAKREFQADSAWLCYAGALEMAAISAFMAGDSNRKTQGYMEDSIVTYLNTCRMVQYAVRATLLSVLCLNNSGLHGEAAKQLIRMTSEDSDLRSAMLLEQAALCFLSGPGSKAMCRKYAFHMVLSGHRFSKAGQKKHAYRSYKQAYQVYEGSGWRLSTDHVQFALGRLASALRRPSAAVQWLAGPLAPAAYSAPGAQPPHQQDAFLREYMLAHQQWVESRSEGGARALPLPLVWRAATALVCAGAAPLAAAGRVPATSLRLHRAPDSPAASLHWYKLEEMLLQVAQGAVPMIFKPSVDLYTEATDANPIVPQGEPMQISITLQNPLKISLLLKDAELLWKFVPNTDDAEKYEEELLSNEPFVAAGQNFDSTIICGQKIKAVLLEGDCTKALTFTVTPLKVGQLVIHGLAYKLINAGEGGNGNGNSVMISGKVNLMSDTNTLDKRLHINVIPETPCLQMTFSETSMDVISGEIRDIDVELRNVGPVDMKNVHIAVSHPECITLVNDNVPEDDFKAFYMEKYQELPVYAEERVGRVQAWRARAARHARPVRGDDDGGGGVCGGRSVRSGAAARARLLLRPRASAPDLLLLAYYETGERARPYRLLRHVFRFRVTEAVEISVIPRRSLRTVRNEVFESMNLSVDIKNITHGKDENIAVSLLEASLLSRQWKLTDITAANESDDSLTAHERLHIIFKAQRMSEELPEGKVDFTCLKIAKHHLKTVANVNTVPYSKFVLDTRSSLLETTTQDFSNKKSGLIQSMLIIRWVAIDKDKQQSAIGQHCVWLDCFTKASSQEKEILTQEIPSLQLEEYDSKTDSIHIKRKSRKDNVVLYKLEHTNLIEHNFHQKKLCLIPITINIVNCYGVPVDVFIDMTQQQSRDSFGELGWAGTLHQGVVAESLNGVENSSLGVSVSLERFSTQRLRVRALCAAPGSYLVGSAFTVTVTTNTPTAGIDGRRPATLFANNASLLVVRQTA